MAIMGQGLVLMIAGMGIVYVFLYVLILISEGASRFVAKFDDLVPDEAPRKKTRAAVPAPANASAAAPRPARQTFIKIAVLMRRRFPEKRQRHEPTGVRRPCRNRIRAF